MVKVYLPSDFLVTLTVLPFASVIVSLSSLYPSFAFTVTVTVLPLEAEVLSTETEPLSDLEAETVVLEPEDEPPLLE